MKSIRWDAPFWAGLVVIAFAVGAFGCIGLAAAQTAGSSDPVVAQIVVP